MAERVVAWTRTALGDLEALIDYIAADDPAAATRVLDRIERRAGALESQSARGRVVQELREVGVLHYRELVERPWRIIYRVEGKRVLVLAVLDSHRDLQALLLERLVRS
ncbi:type II toxin-antitoxin system RelE/ParE family toxin [Luteimonas sp. 8-5]|uniref:type II toxin-antitoxin system RelE/ParE family toxin n=1 Tax=Luteimonas sp. 8-5 TaxID=3039387 RepID=UPI002437418D|nr:type II toxin-antitoxin system RelE/ParE family toxin [Luteimonas sp. 8-5]MDG6348924.1 type II toxin-antitoxin system RelE/ParE family toxin [Luteimonas sp. 8-5]